MAEAPIPEEVAMQATATVDPPEAPGEAVADNSTAAAGAEPAVAGDSANTAGELPTTDGNGVEIKPIPVEPEDEEPTADASAETGTEAAAAQPDPAAEEAARVQEIARVKGIVEQAMSGKIDTRHAFELITASSKVDRRINALQQKGAEDQLKKEASKKSDLDKMLERFETSKDVQMQITAVDYRRAQNGREYAELLKIWASRDQLSKDPDPDIPDAQKRQAKQDADIITLQLQDLVAERNTLIDKRNKLDPNGEQTDSFAALAIAMYGKDNATSEQELSGLINNPMGAIYEMFKKVDWKDKDSEDKRRLQENFNASFPGYGSIIEDIGAIMSGDKTKMESLIQKAKTAGVMAAIVLAALAFSGYMASGAGRS